MIHWHGLLWEPLGIMMDSDSAACPVSVSVYRVLQSIAGFQKWQDFPWQVARAGDHWGPTLAMVSSGPRQP